MNQKTTFLKLVICAFALMFFTLQSNAQVTTAAISGVVIDNAGEGLPGATVVALHVPSGSKYAAVTNNSGRYTLPAVRVGGPFTVTVSFVGYKEESKSGVITNLGTSSNVDFKMVEEGKMLEEISVVSSRSDIFSSGRTGAATTLGREAVNNLPTLSRTMNSITKYNAYSNGSSFAGQDSRFNNITIDGSVFNNGFGLGNDAAAGGRTGTSAISLDAIEQIQINIAPFDIRQSGFAGAGINAVTRSGTNDFSGSVYTFMQSDGLVGKKANGIAIPAANFKENSFGFRIGGPILKNKLFFFANGEFLNRAKPALDWIASRPGATGSVSRTTAADIEDLGKFMQEKFDYNIGAVDQFNNEVKSNKFLARLDFNLNEKNKFTLRYSHHDSKSDALISNSNSGNTAGFGNRSNLALALSPQNTGYIIQDNTRSIVGEWNSTFSGKLANNLIGTFNKQIEDREYRTQLFPTVEIRKDNTTYTTIGFDPFTPDNKLDYSTFNLTDNLTYFAGKHTLTFGGAFEYFKSNNLFFYASNGVWAFNSIEDFKTAANAYLDNKNLTTSPVPVAKFDYRYSLVEGGEAPWQRLKVYTTSFYAQDDFQVTEKFKLAYGLRGDYISVAPTAGNYYNPVVDGLTFKLPDNTDYKVNMANLPKGRLYWSPRIGFNWDVKGNKTTQIRGGSGLFLSRIPYVLISNQLGNNGVNISGISRTTANGANNFPFTLDPSVYRPATTDITKISGYNINASDPNLKFPQIWKTNFAVDQKLPFGIVGTIEGIFNKYINALKYIDANLKPAAAIFSGLDNRDRYPASAVSGTSRYINSQINGALMLTNSDEGYSYSLTTKLEKPMGANGIGGMVGYTYAKARDIATVSSTVDLNTPSVQGLNYLDLAYSGNDLRHRFVGFVNKRFVYGGEFGGATMLTLGMTSQSGFKVSYVSGNDINGDGVTLNDLLFVPNNGNQTAFSAFTSTYTDAAGARQTINWTPAQQQEAWEKFIENNPYLKTRRGKYAERNGGFSPWLTRFDFTAEQDVYINVGGKKNTLRFRADILNVGNMINNKWGVGNLTTGNVMTLGSTVNGVPTYRLATQTINGVPSLIQDSFVKAINIDNVFQVQLGLRYIFN
ncbi:MAG: hypothetical protein CFE22_08445 [Cytophagaceae bacterium BCCC1]|nr:MAG: hypothetical protein CFE22_17185 [Cytophagaceae bacterium BCCC1]OYU66586.1 MAG: hypothetical protein CFE22_08445 [Cytophagaceae bacterium BCCC1]